jgi:dolichol-phosphate mannosyltransferase
MDVELSVVIPVFNEVDNVRPLAEEVSAALTGHAFELLFVDDCSTDGTAQAVLAARDAGVAPIRLLRHSRRAGQSAAIMTGVRHARAAWIVTLDGDRQNDPADIPRLLAARTTAAGEVGLVVGNRIDRRDSGLRRLSSRVANAIRAGMLRDGTPDTGCGLKLMHRETFLQLPAFNHMHRFLPALYQRAGARIVSVPVNHRPRSQGVSKYGLFDRLWVGITDLFGVMWLARRAPVVQEIRED